MTPVRHGAGPTRFGHGRLAALVVGGPGDDAATMIVRRRAVLAVAGALGSLVPVAACAPPTSGVAASCAGPRLALSPVSAAPGQQVGLSVEWLHSGCADTVPVVDPEGALADVPVEVVQGSTRAVVGTISGRGPQFTGALQFALPEWLRPGPAALVLDDPGFGRLAFTVVAGA